MMRRNPHMGTDRRPCKMYRRKRVLPDFPQHPLHVHQYLLSSVVLVALDGLLLGLQVGRYDFKSLFSIIIHGP
jgi:hypothetical protein